MKAHTLLSLLALLGAGLHPALAVRTNASAGAPRQTTEEIEDIGVVAPMAGAVDGKDFKSTPEEAKEEPRFRLNIGVHPEYTTNARLSGDHASSDFIFMPKVEAGYRVPVTKTFAFDSVLRLESGVYAEHDERTFVSYSLQSTFEWRPVPKGPRVFIGAEPYRIDGFDGQGRITEAVVGTAGVDWGYGFNEGRALAFIGYSFNDHFSDPDIDSRINHTVTLGYTQVLAKRLTGQVYYQYQHDNYQGISRTDSRHLTGLSFSYEIDRHFFATLGANFVDNDSTQNRASYQSAGVSFGINYQY